MSEIKYLPSCSGGLCSRSLYPDKYVSQDIYYCSTCKIEGNCGLCFRCAQECHSSRGHSIEFGGRGDQLLCDCKDFARKTKHSCLTALPQVKDTDRCTITVSGNKFISQEVYECLTCGLDEENGLGCCWVCAAVCHQNHHIRLYSQTAEEMEGFLCDCGSAHQNLKTKCKTLRRRTSIKDNQDSDSSPSKRSPKRKSVADPRECQECLICWTKSRDIVLLPCKHLVCCSGCLPTLKGVCPLDRLKFSSVLVIYNG